MSDLTFPQGPDLTVTALSLAVDHRARPQIMRGLAPVLPADAAAADPAALRALLHQFGRVLRQYREAWRMAGVVKLGTMQPEEAEHRYRGLLAELSARGSKERLQELPSGADPVSVVTCAVASRDELIDIRDVADRERVRASLEVYSWVSQWPMVAAAVVWTPPQDNTSLAAAAASMLFPELVPLHGVTFQDQRHCSVCGSPQFALFSRCSRCGASAAAS